MIKNLKKLFYWSLMTLPELSAFFKVEQKSVVNFREQFFNFFRICLFDISKTITQRIDITRIPEINIITAYRGQISNKISFALRCVSYLVGYFVQGSCWKSIFGK